MASFKIIGLVNRSRNYKIDERTGYYDLVANNGSVVPSAQYGLFDILLSDKCSISSIKRFDGEVFQIGDELGGEVNIVSFSVVKNRLLTTVRSTDGSEMIFDIEEFAHKPKVVTPTILTSNVVDGKLNNFIELQKQVEEKCVALKLGQVRDNFTPKETNLKSFLKQFLSSYNFTLKTVYVSNGQVQCDVARRRSLGDIFMICKNYFPECNLHEVIQLLYVDLPEEMSNLGSIICSTIHKRVWYIYGNRRFDSPSMQDEWKTTANDYIKKLAEKPVIIPVAIVEEELTPEALDRKLFEEVKVKFSKGVRFKSMLSDSKFKVDSSNFYNGIRSIILIQSDGSRKQVYDKTSKKTATIIN